MADLTDISAKIMDWDQAKAQVKNWKSLGEKVVFTNGCFDILHYGHLIYLAQAKSFGERLIIGLNSDTSVKRLKGEERPVNDIHTRSMMLASLAVSDMIVLFDEDTPQTLIQALMPDVLIKGGDYKVEEIVGYQEVTDNGGTVLTLPFVEGYSSTKLIEKIKRLKILS